MECEIWCPSWGYEDCTCGAQIEVTIAPEPTLRSVRLSRGYLVGTFSNGYSIVYRALAKVIDLDHEPPKPSNELPRATLLSARRAKKETHTP